MTKQVPGPRNQKVLLNAEGQMQSVIVHTHDSIPTSYVQVAPSLPSAWFPFHSRSLVSGQAVLLLSYGGYPTGTALQTVLKADRHLKVGAVWHIGLCVSENAALLHLVLWPHLPRISHFRLKTLKPRLLSLSQELQNCLSVIQTYTTFLFPTILFSE